MTHFSGPPRDRFLEALLAYHTRGTGLRELLRACGGVVGCTDFLPGRDRARALDLLERFEGGAEPSTYDEAARRLLSIHTVEA